LIPKTRRYPLLLLGLALAARLALAGWDARRPIFPPHHYTDASLYHFLAVEMNRSLDEGIPQRSIPAGKEVYILWTARLYRVFGPRPIVPRLFNCVLAVGALWLWYKTALLVGPPAAALWSLGLLALWPSHVFYSGQHVKESASLLLLAAVFHFFLAAWRSGEETRQRTAQLKWALGAACLAFLGCFRSHLIPASALSLVLTGMLFAYRTKNGKKGALLCLAGCLWAVGGAVMFKPVYRHIRDSIFEDRALPEPSYVYALPSSDDPEKKVMPYSPEHLTQYRKTLHSHGQAWSESSTGRRIETQIFPDAEFRSWLDVLLFLPKVIFYTLFMPLPGLYPMAGKAGRMLASMENILLLILAGLAVRGALRRWMDPGAWCLLAFFLICVPPMALFELDLGSAARHHLQLFPFILPFAAMELARPRERLL